MRLIIFETKQFMLKKLAKQLLKLYYLVLWQDYLEKKNI